MEGLISKTTNLPPTPENRHSIVDQRRNAFGKIHSSTLTMKVNTNSYKSVEVLNALSLSSFFLLSQQFTNNPLGMQSNAIFALRLRIHIILSELSKVHFHFRRKLFPKRHTRTDKKMRKLANERTIKRLNATERSFACLLRQRLMCLMGLCVCALVLHLRASAKPCFISVYSSLD